MTGTAYDEREHESDADLRRKATEFNKASRGVLWGMILALAMWGLVVAGVLAL